jgi:hypothetical protein
MNYEFTLEAAPTGPEELDALKGTRREQFMVAAQDELGGSYKVPSDYFRELAEDLDEEPDTQRVELWSITEEGEDEALFEMWYFPSADNGAVFKAGSAKPTGVQLIQGEFDAPEGGKEAKKLADALQEPFDERVDDEDEEDDDDDDDDDDEDEDDEDE